jgi:N-acetylmuramoyl-L-alanine amidase
VRILFFSVGGRRLLGPGVVFLLLLLAAGTTAVVALDRPRTLSGWLIAVDAGHGGHDKGAWFPDHGLVEKDINLEVAHTLARLLVAEGAAVILIRSDDSFVGLGERAQRANSVAARMFVSIHVNRYPQDPSCCGAQVFYRQGSSAGQTLAAHIQEELHGLDAENRRQAIPGDYKVLRDSIMPAVLVEIGFATNARDRALLMNPQYRAGVASAICRGIVRYAASLAAPDISAQDPEPDALTSDAAAPSAMKPGAARPDVSPPGRPHGADTR